MSVDANNMPHSGIMSFLETHPQLEIGGVILLLVLAGAYFKSKSTPTTASNAALTAASDTSGLTNGVVYRPTQTYFENIYKGANSGNITTTTTSTSTSTTQTATDGGKIITGTGSIPPSPPPTPTPIHSPPPPQPAPRPTSKSLIWDTRYTILGGQTLSGIASLVTQRLRAQGMPGSQSVTWSDLYAHNTATINADSAAHHNPIPGGPWNDIFPGEVITVPRWG